MAEKQAAGWLVFYSFVVGSPKPKKTATNFGSSKQTTPKSSKSGSAVFPHCQKWRAQVVLHGLLIRADFHGGMDR